MEVKVLSKTRLQELRKLHQKKFREERGYVLIEGLRLIRQLIDDGVELTELYIAEGVEPIDSRWQARLKNTSFFHINEVQRSQLSSTKSPQNIFALVKIPAQKELKGKRFLYLDRISDPGNLGTIFRTSKAAGLDGIILSPDSCEVFSPKTIRSSLGAVFTMPHVIEDYAQVISRSAQFIVTDVEEGVSLYSFKDVPLPYILVMGSEAEGVSSKFTPRNKISIKIPMNNGVESLNVAVATGLCLYHLNRDILS
ncbi:MAG: RNA methyltransferase [Candidatus Cloacimonadia bacterium]|jgi:TrmH family RNA methyltransferase